MGEYVISGIRNRVKRGILLLIITAAVAVALAPAAYAVEEDAEIGDASSSASKYQMALENIAYMSSEERAAVFSLSTGYIPDLTPAQSVHDANESAKGGLQTQAVSLPSSYDSRDTGNVSQVRSQGELSTCWAFAAIAAAEASQLAHGQAESPDLSERHLSYFTYHSVPDALGNTIGDSTVAASDSDAEGVGKRSDDPYLEVGANAKMATNALASWTGVVDETAVPTYKELLKAYDVILESRSDENYAKFLAETALDDSLARSLDTAHLRNAHAIAMEDANDVKQAIVDYGAVSAAVNISAGTFSTDGSAYYYNDDEPTTNHEVVLVGWNDAYPAENFAYSEEDDDSVAHMKVPESSTALALDTPTAVHVSNDEASQWYSFTPNENGIYLFASSDNEGDPRATLFRTGETNNLLYMIGHGDDASVDDVNFGITSQLESGKTYYLSCGRVGAEYTVTVTRIGDYSRGADDEPSVPANDGAWLAKNSWGTYFGDNGYVWISYEDACLNADYAKAYAYDLDASDNYDNIYQYDGTTGTCINYIDSGGAIANVFTAKANSAGAEMLEAVSLSLASSNVDYSIQVYLDPKSASDPTSGSPALAHPVTGKVSYAGYHTIELPQAVALKEGVAYAVVVTLSHEDGSNISYDVDTTYGAGIRYANFALFTNAVEAGQSFERDSASAAWDDLSSSEDYDAGDEPASSARLKAFTRNVDSADFTLSLDDAKVSLSPTSVVYNGGAQKPAVTVTYGGSALKQGTDYTVVYARNTEVGTAEVTVTGVGYFVGTKKATFEITAPATPAGGGASSASGGGRQAGDASSASSATGANGGAAATSGAATSSGSKSSAATSSAAGGVADSAKGKSTTTGVAKAKNTLKVKAKTVTVKASKLKKKAQTVAVRKALSVSKPKGAVTYAKVKKGSSAKLSINKKTGKITVKKGTKKGTYKIKVKVTAKGNANYKAGSKTVTVKVNVR